MRILRWVLGVLVALVLGFFAVVFFVVGPHQKIQASFLIFGDTEFSHPELQVNRQILPGLPNVPPEAPRRFQAWAGVELSQGDTVLLSCNCSPR